MGAGGGRWAAPGKRTPPSPHRWHGSSPQHSCQCRRSAPVPGVPLPDCSRSNRAELQCQHPPPPWNTDTGGSPPPAGPPQQGPGLFAEAAVRPSGSGRALAAAHTEEETPGEDGEGGGQAITLAAADGARKERRSG